MNSNGASGQGSSLPVIGAVFFLILWGTVGAAFFYELLTN